MRNTLRIRYVMMGRARTGSIGVTLGPKAPRGTTSILVMDSIAANMARGYPALFRHNMSTKEKTPNPIAGLRIAATCMGGASIVWCTMLRKAWLFQIVSPASEAIANCALELGFSN